MSIRRQSCSHEESLSNEYNEEDEILDHGHTTRSKRAVHGTGSFFARIMRYPVSTLSDTLMHRKGRGAVRLKILVPVALLLLILLYGFNDAPIRIPRVESVQWIGNPANPQHPIELLVAEKRQSFSKLVNKQSTSLEQAVREYRRRYGRRPPPRFDQWFELAQSHDLKLIDEFDVVMRNVEPFWGVHTQTLQERMQSRASSGSAPLTMNSSGIFNGSEAWQFDQFRIWFADLPWQKIINSVEVLINTMDEPTVNAPYALVKEALQLASLQKTSIDVPSPPLELGDPLAQFKNFNKEDSWRFVRDACDIEDPAMKASFKSQTTAAVLPFISDVPKSMDACKDPFIHQHHGIFLSPMNLLLTKQLVPILSVGRPTRFNDVLYPSTFYTKREVTKLYKEKEDIPWHEKSDLVYWVGNPFSGWADGTNWREQQRQRMALLCRPGNPDPVDLLMREGPRGTWVPRPNAIWGDLGEYFHVNIGRPQRCPYAAEACDQQNEVLHTKIEPVEASMKSKYVMDLDGMSFSGRYYRLLKSRAAVMKQTIFEEWHDTWLVPWVHYIPITLEARELGEVTRFLIEDPQGQKIGERIASESREWANQVLRPIDQQLYFLRLLMEMERVLHPDRNSMFYTK